MSINQIIPQSIICLYHMSYVSVIYLYPMSYVSVICLSIIWYRIIDTYVTISINLMVRTAIESIPSYFPPFSTPSLILLPFLLINKMKSGKLIRSRVNHVCPVYWEDQSESCLFRLLWVYYEFELAGIRRAAESQNGMKRAYMRSGWWWWWWWRWFL